MSAVSIGGHVPGALGWVVAEHGRYCAREWQLPAAFECRVAAELASTRRLYEKFGFRHVSEHMDANWGRPMLEQRYEQRLH